MSHTPVPGVDPGEFGKASWGDLVAAADADLTDRVEDLESAVGSGGVNGPASSTDNAIPRFDGTSGATLQNSGITIADGSSGTLSGSNSGDVTLAGTPNYLTIAAQVITRALIDLASHVTGRLPWANVVQVTAGRLLGRASASGAGNVEEIQLGVGLAWNGAAIDCTVTGGGSSTETGSRLISGGEIVWISAYTFRVSAATYTINGTQYTSAEQSVSLSSADPTNDRIDVIAVDDTGTVVAIAGTAAAQPSEPDIDPATQLKLGIVFVAASSSAPTVTTATLYAENTGGPGEWNWTTSGSGFNVNSTNNPHGGTKDIEGTTVAAGAYALATKPSGTLDITTYSLLVFYIRSKVTWNNNRSLQIQFRNSGVLVGSAVTFKNNTFGFDSTNTSSYQQIAIPITAFSIPAGTLINELRLMDAGGSIGFYIDDVSLQTGGSTNVTSGITQAQADARYVQRPGTVTDNAIARYDGTDGSKVQGSTPAIADDGRITTLTDPSSAQDAATKAYVDGIAVNLGKRQRVRAATTANITISTALNNGDSLDGVTLATGDLVLVKNQSSAAENGVYVVGASPARFAEFDTYDEHPGSLIAVAEGSTNADTVWLCTSNAGGTLNTTAITFSALSSGAPTTASYVTLATDGGLANERVLTAGTGISITDGGAGGPVTVAATSTSSGGGADPNSSIYPPFTPSGDDDEFDNGSFSGWTAVNSGSHNPTITETNNRASFLLPGSDAASELHAYMKSRTINTNDWIEVAYSHAGIAQAYAIFGLVFADGTSYGSGDQVTFMTVTNLQTFQYYTFTGYNSASNINGYAMETGYPHGVAFLRFKYLGSNSWQGYVSCDGISWAAVGPSQSRTLTPTKVGFAMTTWGGSNQHVWSVLYVKFGNG